MEAMDTISKAKRKQTALMPPILRKESKDAGPTRVKSVVKGEVPGVPVKTNHYKCSTVHRQIEIQPLYSIVREGKASRP